PTKGQGETGMTPLKALLTLVLPLILVPALAAAQAQDVRTRTAGDYYNRGKERQKQRDLTGAIEDYTFAITFDPQFARASNHSCAARHLLAQFDRAIADATQAIDLKPDYAQACNNRGTAPLDN